MRCLRTTLLAAPLLLACPLPASPVAQSADPSAPQSGEGRVIVLGFDGADARTAAEMMDAGELPNLARLRAEGTFAPLRPSMPPESPVAWAALNSGQNPAKTGVPGFVKRKLTSGGDPLPDLGHQRIEDARPIEEMEVSPLLRVLTFADPPVVGAVAGALVLVGFLVIFLLLLRIHKGLGTLLALALAAVGAWGGYVASDYVPRRVGDVMANPTVAGGFWEVAAAAGVPTIVLDAPMAWDRPTVPGAKVLAGLGLPDARGENGDWFLYTTDDTAFRRPPTGSTTPTAGRVFKVDEYEGRIESQIVGPVDHWTYDKEVGRELARVEAKLAALEADGESRTPAATDLQRRRTELLAEARRLSGDDARLTLPLVVERRDDGRVDITLGTETQTVGEGEWCPEWYELVFELNPLVKVGAVTRVKVLSLDEPFELYVNVLDIDPSHPPFWQPVSAPASFSGELASAIGRPFETVGWACMTMPYKDARIDVETFLEDIEFTLGWREDITHAALERDDWRCLMSVFSTTDRVQHMMYQFYDTEHPMYDAATAATPVTFFGKPLTYADAIPEIYRQMDRVVGEVVERHLRPGDKLLICADHGFQSFRRGVNVNNWLVQNGYMTLRDGLGKSDGDFLRFVDWRRTRAYSLGLGMIWLNMEGRERYGTVSPQDAPQVLAELRRDLLATTDPQDGAKVVNEVYITSEVHHGPHLDLEADVLLGFAPTYRASWGTTLGGIALAADEVTGAMGAGPVLEDNDLNWSGDHVSMDAAVVEGVFFSNLRLAVPEGGAHLLHVAPTALDLLGVQVPEAYDLPPLEVAR